MSHQITREKVQLNKQYQIFHAKNGETIEYIVESINGDNIEKTSITLLLEEISSSIEYLKSLIPEQDIQRKFVLRLNKSGRHFHEGGLYMKINIDQFISHITSDDLVKIHLEKSLLCHELMHNLDQTEFSSLLVELIYNLENDQITRIQEILEIFYIDEDISAIKKSPYIKALNEIASIFSYLSGKEFLENLITKGKVLLPQMKVELRRRVEYLKDY